MTTTHDTQDEVVRNLLRLLEASGATRKQLAQYAGKDPSVITERIKGFATITVPDLYIFAEFFDIHPGVFLYSDEQFTEWLTFDVERSLKMRVRVDLSDSVISIHAAANRSARHRKARPTRSRIGASDLPGRENPGTIEVAA